MLLNKLSDSFQQVVMDYADTTLTYMSFSQEPSKRQEPIVLTDDFLNLFATKLGEQILLEAKYEGEPEPVSEGCEDDGDYHESLIELAKDCFSKFPSVKLELGEPKQP